MNWVGTRAKADGTFTGTRLPRPTRTIFRLLASHGDYVSELQKQLVAEDKGHLLEQLLEQAAVVALRPAVLTPLPAPAYSRVKRAPGLGSA